ncbi:MAG: putative lipid II flippase FtsW [Spirochaetales bacterium]|nr:putative lipid II flippase FtsW [Spirochaetales bacterium]
MSDRFAVERIERDSPDVVFLGLLVLLVGVGLVVMYSSSFYYAQKLTGNPQHFLKKHVWHLAIGGIMALLAAQMSLDLLRRITPFLVLFSFILIMLTFVPGIGSNAQGAQRWIIILGQSFQPSELAKLSVLLYLSHIFTKKNDRIDDFFNTLLPPLLIIGSLAALIYLQNDFSTAFFILLISLAMFFIAGTRLVYFILTGGVAIPLSIVLLLTKEHRVQRIISFLNPQIDPVGTGYQVIAAQAALVRGGIWGSGFGRGTKKLGGLPEAHSDFVFAVLGEEAGFVGILFILTVFIAFAARGFMISVGCGNKYGHYLSFGMTTAIITQALFNIAVVSGLVPATGIPLPFFSTGGSSLLVILIMCGIMLNISRYSARAPARATARATARNSEALR